MTFDGVITYQDLNQLDPPGVLIVVQKSAHAAEGDYLTLFWNGIQANLLYINTDTPADFFPWSTLIPASLVPDGSYPVQYIRMDAAGNLAASAIVTALVQRDASGILNAPTFPEAIGDLLTGDAIADGTPIAVPAYYGIAENDRVQVAWVGANSRGDTLPDSVVTLSHVVTAADVASGFEVSVRPPFIAAIGVGQVSAWYTVQPAKGGLPISSKITQAQVNIAETTLPAPVFPEGNDGWIDASEANSSLGISLAIPAYPGISVNDIVTSYWDGLVKGTPVLTAFNIDTHIVVAADVASGFITRIPSTAITPIGIGEGQAYYRVSFYDGSRGVSAPALVNVDTLHNQLLPAPTFPEASNGGITLSEAADGTPMQISYPGMAAGDGISVYWQGYKSDATTLVSGSGFSEIHTVTAQDVQAQKVTLTIPSANITLIGNGSAIGQYQVAFLAGGMANSASIQVTVMAEPTPSFQIKTTTGAPYWSNPADIVRPCNVATVYGPPGTEIEVNLQSTKAAYFTDGTQDWRGSLPVAGYINLSVYCMDVSTVVVSAFDILNASNLAIGVMVFNDYFTGSGALLKYGYSTGASANGSTVNSLYVWMDENPALTHVTFSVTGDALISGDKQLAIIALSEARSASVNVVDSTAELSTFTINAPQSSLPSSVTGNIEFVSSLADKETYHE